MTTDSPLESALEAVLADPPEQGSLPPSDARFTTQFPPPIDVVLEPGARDE